MDRALKFSLISLLFNTSFSVHHIVFGVITHSWWLFTVGIYYAILSIVRFAALQINKSNYFVAKLSGVLLMILSLSLVGTVILAVIRDRGIVLHEIVMIAMAAYSFAKIILAIINLAKSRKSMSAKLIILRNISFADACVSIFALQRSMLVSFEGMTDIEIRIMNTVTGFGVCIIIFLLGLNLVRKKRYFFNALNTFMD